MRAMVCTSYGPPEVLQLEELPTPEPRDDQIRVRVRATSVGYGDLVIRMEQLAEAHRHVESGQKRGQIVITLKRMATANM